MNDNLNVLKQLLKGWAEKLLQGKVFENYQIQEFKDELDFLIDDKADFSNISTKLKTSKFFSLIEINQSIYTGDLFFYSKFDDTKKGMVVVADQPVTNGYYCILPEDKMFFPYKVKFYSIYELNSSLAGYKYIGRFRLQNLDSLNMTPKRRKIVEDARTEVGTVETGNNQQKYGEWYYDKYIEMHPTLSVTEKEALKWLKSDKWCAQFVSYIFVKQNNVDLTSQAGHNFGFSHTDYGLSGMRKNKDKYTEIFIKKGDIPKPGDIVFYDFSHVGIISEYRLNATEKNRKFKAIEGNTSNISQNNGGEVMEKERKKSDIAAIIRVNALEE